MYSRSTIDDFLAQSSFAVVGVSRDPGKFGNAVFRMLQDRGVKVYAVNSHVDSIDGVKCYGSLKDLPEKVEGVVSVVPPDQTEIIVKQIAELGIRRVWMQQGSESRKAIQYCEQYGIDAVYGRCIMMFAEPVASVHKLHRWALKLLHRLPT